MTQRALTYFFVVLFAGVAFDVPLYAQVEEQEAARQRAAEEARQEQLRLYQERVAAEEARKVRENSQNSLRDFLNDTRELTGAAAMEAERRREMLRQAQLTRVKAAFQGFESSREQLSKALTLKAKLKDPAKELEKSAAVFLEFIKERSSNKRQRFDAREFKDFKTPELGKEALATTERLAPQLSAILKSEEDSVVDINLVMSLSKVEAELLRLQWMTKKLK